MSLNSNTESMEELLARANALPAADEVYAQGYNAALASLPDRVVEIGTEESADYTGTWYWEKWDSGKAVCYGQFSFGTIDCSNSWGNMKESTGMYKTFPSNLFLADTIPTYLEISIVKANAAAFVTQDKNDISAQKTGRFTLSRPTTTTGDSVGDAHIGFYAIGRWK